MCVFIFNPHAGKGKIKKRLPLIVDRLKERFGDVTVREAIQKGDIGKFAKEACGTYDYLIFAGGDGTFYEVINGIANEDIRPILGYIPMGTVCDIAANFGISKKVKKALDIIDRTIIQEADIVDINNGEAYAAYSVTGGALVSLSYATTQKSKRRWGKLAYYIGAVNFLEQGRLFDIECVEPPIDGLSLLMALKSRRAAGFGINREFVPDDGKMQVIAVKSRGKTRLSRYLRLQFTLARLFLSRRRGDFENRNITRISVSHAVISSKIFNWGIDGEKYSAGRLELTVLNKHIRLIIGKKKWRAAEDTD